LDSTALRSALGLFATGVTVVAALDPEGRPRGMTANAFMSVSLDPPLVLVSVRRGSRFHPTVSRAGTYGVSVLPESLEREARRFAGLGVGDHEPPPHFVGRRGAPVLEGATMWLAARVVEARPIGDHTLFVGEVLDFAAERPDDPPLAFFHSSFTGLVTGSSPPLGVDPWGDCWG
jgi:flavin reductase (DIM6/NTAB) family NADH-FMN oxidoreductase RutF